MFLFRYMQPYMDDGEPLSFWESEGEKVVYVDGPVNNPGKPSKCTMIYNRQINSKGNNCR